MGFLDAAGSSLTATAELNGLARGTSASERLNRN